MRVAIIGTGAVGGYFGAKIAQAGFEVSFLARGKQLKAIREHGLKIKSILGDFDINQLNATDSIQQLGQSDLVILAVKAWQIAAIREELKKIVHSNSMVLPLQNGVLAAEELGEALHKQNILGGVCRIICKIESPGVINHFGATPSIVFGRLDKVLSSRLNELKLLLEQAEINSRISEDIESDLWKKFGFICVGGLMAVARSTLGEIRENAETRSLTAELIAEIVLLASNANIQMGQDFVENTLTFIDSLPEDTTFSMARDIWDGNPSELDYLNGAVVQLGQKYRVKTPVNRFIYHLLKLQELKARAT